MRASNSGKRLTATTAAIAKGMLNRGDRQHDIASWFGVNQGRIAELAAGDEWSGVQPVMEDLPPPGPYFSGEVSTKAVSTLIEAQGALTVALGEISKTLKEIKDV